MRFWVSKQSGWVVPARPDGVLLDALLGKADTYRVIVDCKTSASGSVGDQQVDWVTLGDHKIKHDAQYVALQVPNPNPVPGCWNERSNTVSPYCQSTSSAVCHASTGC